MALALCLLAFLGEIHDGTDENTGCQSDISGQNMSTYATLSTMKKGLSVSEYIDGLQGRARYTFSLEEVREATRIQSDALTKALQRLTRVRRLCQIRRAFYVIVPIEYSSTGVLPPDWFIDDFMRYIKLPYYVGLLSAASFHGAGHQQSQEFQIVVPCHERSINRKNLKFSFFRYSNMAKVPTAKIKTFTGYVPVSTPESTALDLCRFAGSIGGLSVTLAILTELAKNMSPEALITSAKIEAELSQVQRLGWLLEESGNAKLVAPLADWLSFKQPSKAPLDASKPCKGFKKDSRWQVIVNTKPESDI